MFTSICHPPRREHYEALRLALDRLVNHRQALWWTDESCFTYLIDLSHALSAVLGTKWTAILMGVHHVQLKAIHLSQSFTILHLQHPDIPRR